MKYIRRIIKVIKWLPIIWRDRDWDQHYFFEILRFKLKNMEKFFRHDANYVYAEKDADRMKVCIMLLDRLIGDVYEENAFYFHDKKWGELDCWIDNGKFECTRPNITTKEDKKKERAGFVQCMSHSEYMRGQDMEYLTKHLNKYIFNWWD